MITFLDKPADQLKIGLFGQRVEMLSDVMDAHRLPYVCLKNPQQISESLDLAIGSGVYQLLSNQVANAPTYGTAVFHETPLPEGRGWAPLQWTVENQRPNLTVTLIQITDQMDAGPILYQSHTPIRDEDGLSDLESCRQQGIQTCFSGFIGELKQNVIVARPQTGQPSVSPKRSPQHSELDPNLTLNQLWSKIRGLDNHHFPGFFKINNRKITIRYDVEDLNPPSRHA